MPASHAKQRQLRRLLPIFAALHIKLPVSSPFTLFTTSSSSDGMTCSPFTITRMVRLLFNPWNCSATAELEVLDLTLFCFPPKVLRPMLALLCWRGFVTELDVAPICWTGSVMMNDKVQQLIGSRGIGGKRVIQRRGVCLREGDMC